MAKKSGKVGVKAKTPPASRASTKSKRAIAAKPTAKAASKAAVKPAVTRKATDAGARDDLDGLIEAAARVLELPIDPQWLPAIKANLQVTLRHAALVNEFVLSDEAEPAAVFEA